MPRRLALLLAAVATLLVLGGCAAGYTIDSQVLSFSHLQSLPERPTYRFERLPSQQAIDPQQTALEVLADPALHKAGLRRDDSAPRYSVLVSLRARQVLSPYADPYSWGGFGWGAGMARGGVGIGFGGPLFPRPDTVWFEREASVLVRDLASNEVVYETRALNQGPWLDERAVLPALFDAALQGFPNPPPGWRRVDVHIGG